MNEQNPAHGLARAISAIAAARHEAQRYLEWAESLSPLLVDVDHVIDGLDLLEEAELRLCGGNQ